MTTPTFFSLRPEAHPGTAPLYTKVGHSLRVGERSVIGTPIDFYVAIKDAASGWIKGAPHLYQRLERAFQARHRDVFDTLADQLMAEHS